MAPRPGRSFPRLALFGLDGRAHRTEEAWSAGPALFAIGHSDCETSRLLMPFVDRLHRRQRAGATVVAVLQDAADVARAVTSELDLGAPVWLDAEPHPLGTALQLTTVPTLVWVGTDGRMESVSEAFRRDDLEALARRLAVPGPFLGPDDRAPALRPG